MPILESASLFISLIDHLVSLLKRREMKRREYFEKIIEPLYVGFKPLAEDYLKLFRHADRVIRSSKKRPTAKAVFEIREKREEFAATRGQLRVLLKVCEKNTVKRKDEELTEFVGAMARFFQPMAPGGVGSLGQGLVDFFERSARFSPKIVEERYRRSLPGASARLESSYYEISGRYMELKLKSMGE